MDEAPHCIVCDAPATTTCGDHHSPLDADELAKLRACLHDEQTLPNGADPSVHGLYDYYETTKRLVNTVAARDAEIAKLRELLASAAEHVESATYLFAEDNNLDEEDGRVAMALVDDCRKALGLPELAMHFVCEDCGEHVAADEDGCCASCGADCREARCECVIAPSDEAPTEATP